MKTFRLVLLGLFCAGIPVVTATQATAGVDPSYVSVRVHQKVRPTFPVRPLYEGVLRGETTLILEIDAAGRLTDKLVTTYTHRDFATQAVRAVEQWAFEPAIVNGNPVASVMALTLVFEMNGVVAIEKRVRGFDEEEYQGRFPYFPRGADELDRMPVPIDAQPPIYPKQWIDDGRQGTVTLDFYIDESGAARVPVIVAENDPLLAAAAVAAVKQWRFQPPRSKGKPVLVHVQQDFVFKNPKRSGPES